MAILAHTCISRFEVDYGSKIGCRCRFMLTFMWLNINVWKEEKRVYIVEFATLETKGKTSRMALL